MRKLVRDYDAFNVRLPDGLRDDLASAAKANGTSMNAEAVARLSAGRQYTAKPLTAHDLAEALGAFWNAAIGEAHNRDSTVAMDCAVVMAAGIAAVAEQLKGDA